MTEAEWLAATAPAALLDQVRSQATPRKKRLFGCACCQRVAHLLPDPRCRTAVRVAERFADGDATADALATAYRAAQSIIGRYTRGEMYTDAERFGGTAAAANVASDDPDHAQWA